MSKKISKLNKPCIVCSTEKTQCKCDDCSRYLCKYCKIKIINNKKDKYDKHKYGICFECFNPKCSLCSDDLIYNDYNTCHTYTCNKKICNKCINYGYCIECFEKDSPKTKCDLCNIDLKDILNNNCISDITCSDCDKILCDKCLFKSKRDSIYCINCMDGNCNNCKDHMIKDSGYYCRECNEEICNYCSGLYCDSDYCEDCVPEDLIKQKIIEEQEPQRYKLLEYVLEKQGLTLRDDSKLCYKYIKTGEVDLEYIIERMSQMKYLYEYCDMKEELDKVAIEHEECLEAGYYPDMSVFEEAESNILNRIDDYPEIWPWHLDKYALKIQRACHNWLWKPVTADGKEGINLRIGLKALNIKN